MWSFEHTVTTSATPDQLWDRYRRPETWPEWDHETASVSVEGPMVSGARGTLKPVRGPETPFTFTEVTPGAGFTNVSRLPLARMSFEHVIEPTAAGSRFTHRVTITGPLSPLFGRMVGRSIAAGLPAAMQRLARLAETARTAS